MQEVLRDQNNAEGFQGSEECRRVWGLRRIKRGLKAQKNAVRFEGSEECKKL